ncbi:MAG: hypothetical protein HY526_04740 [Betaproteobacteria bacterium]|nr:hypothetical protein [Betaproteobacteria bacterium]
MTAAFTWRVLVFLAAPLLATAALASEKEPPLEELAASILPADGHHSAVVLGDSIVKLVQEGVLEPRKLEAVYARRGGIPAELKDVTRTPSRDPILLTRENARVYVTLLWPLGLANRMVANNDSPLNGPRGSRFASTGGWNLGRETSGAVYFNKFPIVGLTTRQEELVLRIALNIFRPCCDNSTFFQDCNHGSALLGLLALGAAQGLSEDELYREALAFNAFWFPHHYLHTALYFKAVRGIQWQEVDPREALSTIFSSRSGWQANVAGELERRGLLPRQGGADCSI